MPMKFLRPGDMDETHDRDAGAPTDGERTGCLLEMLCIFLATFGTLITAAILLT